MAKPDYSKCWNCGRESETFDEGRSFTCPNCKDVQVSSAVEWKMIHDRIEQVAEERVAKEREECAEMIEWRWEYDGADCAARIRARGK